MIDLGDLRVSTIDGLPFAREKLRIALILSGLRPVLAGQITSFISQALRSEIPTKIRILLSTSRNKLTLHPAHISGPYDNINLNKFLNDSDVDLINKALSRLTLDELLNDLEHQVQDRTAELEHERERSERLLNNMLPKEIATRMKDGETIADAHEATVLFADIKGFTTLAKDRSASEIVEILDRIFRRFDIVAEKHGLEKIKTIGDCYMAAAGLPIPKVDHVDRAVLMGLDIVTEMSEMREDFDVEIDVRIGIHTGPLVAGVIGTKKYSYDIWGDTVNVASRMESHGIPGKVQVSDDVRKVLGERYKIEERGSIEIKNRGTMKTWLVSGVVSI